MGDKVARRGWLTLDRASWMARHLLPYEAEVRRWIAARGRVGRTYEVDDIIQEAYARIGTMDLASIANPRAYFYQTARNLIFEQLKRDRIVPIEGLADHDLRDLRDGRPGPEGIASAHQDLLRFQQVLETLPEQCRQVLLLAKVECWPQKAIAARLRLSTSTVEKHLSKALKLMLQRYESESGQDGAVHTPERELRKR
jgi:RNA polymerase sigma factor (sigma-70 family)